MHSFLHTCRHIYHRCCVCVCTALSLRGCILYKSVYDSKDSHAWTSKKRERRRRRRQHTSTYSWCEILNFQSPVLSWRLFSYCRYQHCRCWRHHHRRCRLCRYAIFATVSAAAVRASARLWLCKTEHPAKAQQPSFTVQPKTVFHTRIKVTVTIRHIYIWLWSRALFWTRIYAHRVSYKRETESGRDQSSSQPALFSLLLFIECD